MATTVRTSAGVDFSMKRATAVLSDGTAVIAVPETNGAVRSLLIYTSANRTAWTLKNTITPTDTLAANTFATIAVGANNNLHIAWKGASGDMKYMLLTYAAGNFTAGSEETVGSGSGQSYRYLDMDVLSGNIAVVGVTNYAGGVAKARSWVRRGSDNAWTQLTDFQFMATAGPAYGQFSLARDAGNANVFAYAVKRGDSTGDEIRVKTINNATGAEVSDVRVTQGLNSGSTYRDFMLFSKGSNDWVFIGIQGSSTFVAFACRFNAAGLITGITKNVFSTALKIDRNTSPVTDAVTFGFVGGDGLAPYSGAVIYHSGTQSYVIPVVFDDPAIRWGSQHYWAGTDGVSVLRHYAGNNANTNFRKLDEFSFRAAASPIKSWWNQTPSALNDVSPGAGETITTDQPVLRAYLSAGGSTRPQANVKGKWLVATNAGFTANLRTVESPNTTYYAVSGTTSTLTTLALTGANELFQGSWYVRGTQRDEFGVESTSVVDHAFTNSHPSTDIGTTPNNSYLAWGTTGAVVFAWKFTSTSPSEVETSYQLTVELAADGTIIYDSGKVADGVQIPQGSSNSVLTNIAAGYKDTPLRWRVRSWDSDDVVGNYSDYQLFQIGDAPTIAITAPVSDGTTVTTPSPTVTWTFAGAGGRTQATYRLVFANAAGNSVLDTGTISGTATSYTPPNPVLLNNSNYSVTLIVTDTAGLSRTLYRTFVVTFTQPAAPTFTINSSTYSQQGYLQITWDNSSQDTDFNSWRVYRRLTGAANWVLAAEYTDALANYSYTDWFLPSGVTYDYAVVQSALRFGSVVESPYNASTINATTEDYWLINPNDSSTNVRLNITISDDYSEEYEEETLNIIGRGRKKDYGTRFGYNGTIVAQLRDRSDGTARVQKMQVQLLKDLRSKVYLRNPFGDIWQVQFSDIQFSRDAGVGQREFGTLTIPYQEVAD